MYPEVEVTARWWADWLRSPTGSGNAFVDAFALVLSKHLPPIEDAQIEAFESALARHLQAITDEGDNWRPEDPLWGSLNRVTRTDYAPDGLLASALRAAGIDGIRLPIKTVVWCNPGGVEVKCGYGAQVIRIYPPKECEDETL